MKFGLKKSRLLILIALTAFFWIIPRLTYAEPPSPPGSCINCIDDCCITPGLWESQVLCENDPCQIQTNGNGMCCQLESNCISEELSSPPIRTWRVECGGIDTGTTFGQGALTELLELNNKEDDEELPVIVPELSVRIPGFKGFTANIREGDFLSIPWIGEYFFAIYQWALVTIAVLAVIMTVIAGLKWMLAAGNAAKIGEAKEQITNSLIGLLLVLSSYLVLNFINPELTIFRPLEVGYIERIELPDYPRAGAGVSTYHVPATVIQRINQLIPDYQAIAGESNLPWELLATMHFSEGANNPNQSARNGFALCNMRDMCPTGGCDQPCNTFRDELRCTAKCINQWAGYNCAKGTIPGPLNLSNATNDANNPGGVLANLFFRYGGCSGSIDTRPNVMNNFDSNHINMRFENYCVDGSCCGDGRKCRECCPISGTYLRDGNLVFFQKLKNPTNYDENNELISLELP